MKYSVKFTALFKREYKLSKRRGLPIAMLQKIVAFLAEGKPLPLKNRDHALTGEWVGYRECRILPNCLLVYRIQEDILVLTLIRTGSHSDIFGK